MNKGTVKMVNLNAARRALSARDPGFVWRDFRDHVRFSFLVLQDAWSSLEWEKARPYETDNLFQTHRFWIERYRAARLVNRTEDIEIESIEPCRLDRDPYYDVITVRIFASMLDYTEDEHGKVVGGNRDRRRRFSEYWTYLRRTGVSTSPQRQPGQCPSCGAPISGVDAAGICTYCNAKVVSGEFDWTLAQIDQDETYTGR